MICRVRKITQSAVNTRARIRHFSLAPLERKESMVGGLIALDLPLHKAWPANNNHRKALSSLKRHYVPGQNLFG